jgi:cell division septation protein DedD
MTDKRGFDWGPPAKSGDGLKDYLIYLIIIIALGFGVWILFDIRDSKGVKTYQQAITEEQMVSSSTSSSSNHKEPTVTFSEVKPLHTTAVSPSKSAKAKVPDVEIVYSDKPEFYVQLGAFEDEASASEIFNFLKDNDFEPILKAPNEQLEIYRVVVGPFTSEADADYRAEKLNELGLPCFVVEY